MFELSGTHELHTINTIYTKWPRRKALRPPLRVRGGLFCVSIERYARSCIGSGYDVRPPVLECEEVFCVSIERYARKLHTKWPRGEARRPRLRVRGGVCV